MSAWWLSTSTASVTNTYITATSNGTGTILPYTSASQLQLAQAQYQQGLTQLQAQGIGPPPIGGNYPYGASVAPVLDRIFKVQDGQACDIQLPDGSVIYVDDAGSYTIDDKNAKVVYRANRARDFNKFINVSDRIEEFFEFCGEQDVAAAEMMELPMKLFVGWLVLKAAEADMEEPPADIKLIPYFQQRVAPPRCRSCGRFILHEQKKANLEFCNAVCFERKLLTLQPRALPPPTVPLVCEQIVCEPEPSPSEVQEELLAA